MSGAFDADFRLYLQLSAPLFRQSLPPCGLTSLPGDKAKKAFVSSARAFHVFHDTPKTMVDGVSKIGKFELWHVQQAKDVLHVEEEELQNEMVDRTLLKLFYYILSN